MTNLATDVIAAAAHNTNYSTIWRTSLGIGVVFPLVLLLLRMRLKEPEEFTKEAMRRQTPYILVLKFYWFRLLCVSLIWFLYNVRVPGMRTCTVLSAKSCRSSPSTPLASTRRRF